MDRERNRLTEIGRQEAWLEGFASPLPGPALLGRVKQAVHLEVEALRLLEDAEATAAPPAELLARVKDRVRQELRARSRRSVRSWWPGGLGAAAACLVLAVGLGRQNLGPGSGSAGPDVGHDLARFVEALSLVLEGDDVQLALLKQDLRDYEWNAARDAPLGAGPVEADLSDVRRAIESLGDEGPLWSEDIGGDDV